MKTIHKYFLADTGGMNVFGAQALNLPVGSKPIHGGIQDGKRVVWVEVEVDSVGGNYVHRTVRHNFYVVGTGRKIPDSTQYLSTFFEGSFVWHLYWMVGDTA